MCISSGSILNAMRIAGLALLLAALGAAQQPPNIVLILADDLGWSQIGANGGEAYRTPSIDRLAAEGMRFTSAHSAAAVCSPTGAALMSGSHPARLHLTDHIIGKWHLSQAKRPPASLPYNPDKQGFDDVLVTYKPIVQQSDPELDPQNVQAITDHAIQFLARHGSRPFSLYLPHNSAR